MTAHSPPARRAARRSPRAQERGAGPTRGGGRRLTGTGQGVNNGRVLSYVAVASKEGSDAVAVSAVLRGAVADSRTINPGGIWPMAIAVPAVLVGLIVLALV